MNEVILHEIIFSNEKKLTLSLVIQKYKNENCVEWAVATEGRSNNPIIFFNNSEDAKEDFKKKCGELAMGGLTIISNSVFGNVNGSFNPERKQKSIKIKKCGYKVIKHKDIETAQKWKDKIFNSTENNFRKKTLKLKTNL